MKKHSKNSIWNRLKRSFLIILFVPILALGGYMIYSSVDFVKDERMLEARQIIEQNVLDLDRRMEQCETSLIYAASNYTLQEFLQMNPSDFLKVNQASQNVGPLLYNVLLSNSYYKKLYVFTDRDFSVRNDLIKVNENVKNEKWYLETLGTTETCWWYDDEKIYLSRKIETAFPKKTVGVICAELKTTIFEESFQIFENMPIRITMGKDELLYESSDWKDGYFKNVKKLDSSDWDIDYQISREFFYPGTWMTILIPVMIILSVLVLAGFFIFLMLKLLVRDVEYVVSQVEKVKSGNLEVKLHPVQTEELNILVGSINGMLEKIRKLIQKVYQTELEQKELELEVLQSKISPHFLYNNLSAINWIAIEKGQDSIYEITTQMATFYRTALNKGKKTDKLELEIANIKAYIRLQLISHEDNFDVVYNIQEDILMCIVPTFILQPLVENAIEHGIDLLRGERGAIEIRAYQQDNKIYLEVRDNGKELYREIGESILDTSKYGYGTSNVHRRIQLMMGEAYGLQIFASENGTVSKLCLKSDSGNFL